MSKKIYLFSLVLLALAFVSCSETEEVGKYDNWRARNEAFIDSLANVYATASGRGGLERIEMLTAPGNYIYYKEMEPMTDHVVKAGNPKYTDYVKVYYKGTNILGEYFDGNFKGDNPVVDGKDPSEGDSPTTIFQVSGGNYRLGVKCFREWKLVIVGRFISLGTMPMEVAVLPVFWGIQLLSLISHCLILLILKRS